MFYYTNPFLRHQPIQSRVNPNAPYPRSTPTCHKTKILVERRSRRVTEKGVTYIILVIPITVITHPHRDHYLLFHLDQEQECKKKKKSKKQSHPHQEQARSQKFARGPCAACSCPTSLERLTRQPGEPERKAKSPLFPHLCGPAFYSFSFTTNSLIELDQLHSFCVFDKGVIRHSSGVGSLPGYKV